MSDELKPCPFCGADGNVIGETDLGWFCVICRDCNASSPCSVKREHAEADWNARAEVASELVAEIASLRAQLAEADTGALDERRSFAAAWEQVTKQKMRAVDFTADALRNGLRSRWFERRSLFDGTAPAVGQRVVTVREVAARWGLLHGHDELVHEITSLLSGDAHLVECGSQQIGVGMLQLAPAGAEVTCRSCKGWHVQMARLKADSEAFRAKQFDAREAAANAFEAAAQMADAMEAEFRILSEGGPDREQWGRDDATRAGAAITIAKRLRAEAAKRRGG